MSVRPDSEQTVELLENISQGAESAFDQLFARFRNPIRAAIELRFDDGLRSRVDPSDVVQETQLEAYRRLPDYLERQPMPFHLWLRKMAQERLIMARRRHLGRSRRAVGKELALPDQSSALLGQQLLAPGKSPSQQVNAEELACRVRRAVGQLPDMDREILLMRTYEGLSYQEIACLVEIEVAAARKRHGRALVRLHKLLAESGLSESQL
jgi:RNA polymerase sigma-70 factor (ECF subfamily)